ncbi:MAG: hypothetical protein E7313_07905 [Clostridiales bacterium]|nr:hypothetical protein [Clostridiales bacterium]MBE5806607.1 hypothetical protein [Clostridiales bacterium]
MKINRVKRIVRKNLRDYSNFEQIIEDLEKSKDIVKSKDINSSIQSKNKISNSVEVQAIRNINIDMKIEEIRKWKEIFDLVFDEAKEECSDKEKVLIYKYKNNMSTNAILNILNIPQSTLRNWLMEFVLECAILAIDRKLVNINKL